MLCFNYLAIVIQEKVFHSVVTLTSLIVDSVEHLRLEEVELSEGCKCSHSPKIGGHGARWVEGSSTEESVSEGYWELGLRRDPSIGDDLHECSFLSPQFSSPSVRLTHLSQHRDRCVMGHIWAKYAHGIPPGISGAGYDSSWMKYFGGSGSNTGTMNLMGCSSSQNFCLRRKN